MNIKSDHLLGVIGVSLVVFLSTYAIWYWTTEPEKVVNSALKVIEIEGKTYYEIEGSNPVVPTFETLVLASEQANKDSQDNTVSPPDTLNNTQKMVQLFDEIVKQHGMRTALDWMERAVILDKNERN